jgi:hypothetical protein
LLPDLLQDLRKAGLGQASFDALFNSAEAYLKIWATCEAWNSSRIRALQTSVLVHPA